VIELFKSLFSFLQEAFKLRKPEEVRIKIAEEKAPLREVKVKAHILKRVWHFLRRGKKIERKAKRKGLDDELDEELINKIPTWKYSDDNRTH